MNLLPPSSGQKGKPGLEENCMDMDSTSNQATTAALHIILTRDAVEI
jgi:hypothetical protein